MKAYTVFNVAQIDGLEPAPAAASPIEQLQLIKQAETFMAATGAQIRHGGNRAFYTPGSDHIQLPPVQAFRDVERYTATKAHEMIHWSGVLGAGAHGRPAGHGANRQAASTGVLRANSRLMVDLERPSIRAMARTPQLCLRMLAIVMRSSGWSCSYRVAGCM